MCEGHDILREESKRKWTHAPKSTTRLGPLDTRDSTRIRVGFAVGGMLEKTITCH